MERFISIVIPNRNGRATIAKCLDAAFKSKYEHFEVVVADDCSTDGSAEIIKRYPCRLVQLDRHGGASSARNRGAENSRGEVIFFIDADCLITEDALSLANKAITEQPGAVIGGTYTPLPCDHDFFSTFQSLFVHYSETRRAEPDYIATHAMAIDRKKFIASGGFREDFFPILEDVEFCHRLRRSGIRIVMKPGILVTHIFHFTLFKSLRNAFRKSNYWTAYSFLNKDLLADSGTASLELKLNGTSFVLMILLGLLFIARHQPGWLVPVPFLFAANLFFSSGLLKLFSRSKGLLFTAIGALYYTLVYPLPVIAGGLAGVLKHGLIRRDKEVILPNRDKRRI